MKRIEIVKYECEKCGARYDSPHSAQQCESKPIREDRGVKIGDEVLITSGDGAGLRCKIESVGVHRPDYGPSAYAHTVYLSGKVIGSWGHRQLSFDSYKTI
jgi:hypothetical protein